MNSHMSNHKQIVDISDAIAFGFSQEDNTQYPPPQVSSDTSIDVHHNPYTGVHQDMRAHESHVFANPNVLISQTTNYIDPNMVTITLRDGADAPCYQTQGASGADLSCCQTTVLMPHRATLVDTGVAIALPTYTTGLVYLRSSMSTRKNVILSNGVGVIDSDYRGTIKVCLTNLNNFPITISKGDRIAQLVITPIIRPKLTVVTELGHTNRGDGAFGSTGV